MPVYLNTPYAKEKVSFSIKVALIWKYFYYLQVSCHMYVYWNSGSSPDPWAHLILVQTDSYMEFVNTP